MKHLSESNILKQFSKPPGDPPGEGEQQANSPIDPFPLMPIDMPSTTFEKGIKRRHKNREVLIQWIKENLEDQIDYGKIHFVENCPYAHNGSADLCADPSHWSKPFLWKSGAERILGILGLSVRFPNLKIFELAVSHKQELNQVILKCQVCTHAGKVIAEGVGARNVGQDRGVLNTSIKMCARASMVDATIRACGLTNVFGQNNAKGKPMPTGSPCNADKLTGIRSSNVKEMRQKPHGVKYITQPQENLILRLAGRFGVTIEGLNKRCKDTFGCALKNLERHHGSKLISELNKRF
jgi:hypothetical protein